MAKRKQGRARSQLELHSAGGDGELPAAVAAFVRELAWGLKYAERNEDAVAAYAVRELPSEQRRATRAKVLKTLDRPETHVAIRRLWAEQIDHAQLFFEGDLIGFLRRIAQRIA